jgi:hypothetical protein
VGEDERAPGGRQKIPSRPQGTAFPSLPTFSFFLNCSASAVNYPIDFKSVRTVFEDMQETAYVCHYETGGALSDKL